MTGRRNDRTAVLVFGGAGFIGSNLTRSLLEDGHTVTVFDNLSRQGVGRNLDWLQAMAGEKLTVIRGDIRDAAAVRAAVDSAAAIYHFAAQTAVTTSLVAPQEDFSVNAQGTLNVLEAVRAQVSPVPVIFASTNKVYGSLGDLPMVMSDGRYHPEDAQMQEFGIGEDRPLSFCTPYGCSKGVADQYVLDYAASYGIPTAVLRMSCIYGPRQFGTEDQGWLAHFLIAVLRNEPITIYGNGKQVRDVLFVDDAVRAYRLAMEQIDTIAGTAFNLGGGPQNAVTVNDVLEEIGRLTRRAPQLDRGPWRTGDQLYFVADTRRIAETLGWEAQTGWRDGLARLADWLAADGHAPALAEQQRQRAVA